jgi:hypothetical protein
LEPLQILVTAAAAVYAAFGLIHFFWPRIFHWDEATAEASRTFRDTIVTVNFYMCLQIVTVGAALSLAALLCWNNRQLVAGGLLLMVIQLSGRLAYGIAKPIRIPRPGVHAAFLALFAAELLVFAIALVGLGKW